MGWSILNRRLLIMFRIQNSLNVCRCILIIHWKQRCFPLLMGWSLQRSINFLSDLPELIHVDLNAANYPSSLRMYLFALFFLLNRDNGKSEFFPAMLPVEIDCLTHGRSSTAFLSFFAIAMMRIPVWFHVFGHEQKNRIQLRSFLWCSGNCEIFSHRIHVLYFYLHLIDFYGTCR